MLCDAFLSRRDKKEEQEDSVLAQRYRSYMSRMASFMGIGWDMEKVG